MKTRMLLSLGLSAFVLGGSMVGCTANRGGLASVGSRDAVAAAKIAARDAERARKALMSGRAAEAVAAAESAVALMPQNAGYRALLGQGYLQAGRFASARAAFTDALALEPGDGRSALNLALAQTALGDWHAARATLEANAAIPQADRGLALALAGDPAGGAAMLTDFVRSGQGTPQARQNLALSLALAGEWQGARIVASADMPPADVDGRLQQWAAFAKPQSASDQVASLLGVQPAQDPGQPAALALSVPDPAGQAVAQIAAAPVPAVAPVIVAAAPAVAATPVAVSLPAEQAKPLSAPKPAPLLRAAPSIKARSVKVAVTRAAAPVKGDWFVQVGAFRDPAVAQNGWRHVTRRMPALARNVPTTARFAAAGGAFYRLAVGGFARTEADTVCRRYRAIGGACFVRAGAGDQIASWAARKPIQLASR